MSRSFQTLASRNFHVAMCKDRVPLQVVTQKQHNCKLIHICAAATDTARALLREAKQRFCAANRSPSSCSSTGQEVVAGMDISGTFCEIVTHPVLIE
jgi:hypothetical protein